MIQFRFVFPLILFGALVVFLWRGLSRDPSFLPSALIGRPVPAFQATSLDGLKMTNRQLEGEVTLLNVWATGCADCQLEHPLLIEIAKKSSIQLIGLNYKDNQQSASQFLSQMGNPYQQVIYDPEGKYGMLFGVYGTPETYLIDKKGIIRYRYVGPITLEIVDKDLLPRIVQLQSERLT